MVQDAAIQLAAVEMGHLNLRVTQLVSMGLKGREAAQLAATGASESRQGDVGPSGVGLSVDETVQPQCYTREEKQMFLLSAIEAAKLLRSDKDKLRSWRRAGCSLQPRRIQAWKLS
jgi:hypothetical protein